MNAKSPTAFSQAGLLDTLNRLDAGGLDELDFGVIGFGRDADARVERYNATERRGSGLEVAKVVGLPLFGVVAQCMNNFMVAQRFDDADAAGEALDAELDYTFTLRMRPTPVRLRLLSRPDVPLRYIAVQRAP